VHNLEVGEENVSWKLSLVCNPASENEVRLVQVVAETDRPYLEDPSVLRPTERLRAHEADVHVEVQKRGTIDRTRSQWLAEVWREIPLLIGDHTLICEVFGQIGFWIVKVGRPTTGCLLPNGTSRLGPLCIVLRARIGRLTNPDAGISSGTRRAH